MTRGTFIRRSLRFHARLHFRVLLGAAIASAVLTGALLVGDSMRQTLVERALSRLGPTQFALHSQDRLFLQELADSLQTNATLVSGRYPTALTMLGTVVSEGGSARVNRAVVLGVHEGQWPEFAGWRRPGSGSISEEALERWKTGEAVFVNETLATQLKVKTGDEIIIRLRKPSALAQDAVITPREDSAVAIRLPVGAIVSSELLGDFSLAASQLPPANVFLPLAELQKKVGVSGRVNLMLAGSEWLAQDSPTQDARELVLQRERLQLAVNRSWQIGDAQLSVRVVQPVPAQTGGEQVAPFVELTTERIFLEPQVVKAALPSGTSLAKTVFARDRRDNLELSPGATNGSGVLTYLANLMQAGSRATPYSMVTAAGPPLTPADLRDNEILVNDWLARDLQVGPGDRIDLSYYVVDSATRLIERTNAFTVRAIVPMKGIHADRTLMPEFPGLAKAESTHDWDAGFPLVHTIRDEDEAYWKQYRGTPKAFVTLAAGQLMWANRFGNLTSIRYPVPAGVPAAQLATAIEHSLLAQLQPTDFGLNFQAIREQALRAANQSQDFGQLFLGFSFFLVVAALLLMALLFQFSLDQRTPEIGTLLALGFTPRQVRRLFLFEGAVLSLIGGIVGAAGGIGYGKAMLWALVTHWRSAVGTSVLEFHVTPGTLVIGIFAGTAVALGTIWLTLRKQARQPAAALLSGTGADSSSGIIGLPGQSRRRATTALLVASLSAALAFALLAWAVASGAASAGAFFGAGSLLLIAALSAVSRWLLQLGSRTSAARLTLSAMGFRGAGRRRARSLATIALLACGAFVIASIGVFRLDSRQAASRRDSGTGGFALAGETALPLLQDLNTASGREALGLNEAQMRGVHVVPFRLREGEDASCLNLNRAQKPRLLGVKPELLAGRFTFTRVLGKLDLSQGWRLLESGVAEEESAGAGVPEIPAIGDANSIQWALGKKVGDTIDYLDGNGQPFKLRLVGAVANSILQGSLIIDEAEFLKSFPGETGYRFLLIDAPAEGVGEFSATLSRALQDSGLEIVSTADRLNAFNAVQNTYLGTFQILGGLGLLLGSAGLGVVVLRNVLERRGEFGLLTAVGFRRRALQRLLLAEHGALLALGLGIGLASAAIAVLPALLTPGTELPLRSLFITLAGVIANGAFWTWLATRAALRGELLSALRNE